MSKRHHSPAKQEPLPEINWKSFYEAGLLSSTEYSLARRVERDPSSCDTSLLREYLLLRANHGLLPGAKAPEHQIAPAGVEQPAGAFDAYLEASQSNEHTLKIRLLLKILDPDSKYFGKDYRREWNKMVGFELFDLSKG